jgi:hypothetical protein
VPVHDHLQVFAFAFVFIVDASSQEKSYIIYRLQRNHRGGHDNCFAGFPTRSTEDTDTLHIRSMPLSLRPLQHSPSVVRIYFFQFKAATYPYSYFIPFLLYSVTCVQLLFGPECKNTTFFCFYECTYLRSTHGNTFMQISIGHWLSSIDTSSLVSSLGSRILSVIAYILAICTLRYSADS